MMTKRDYVIITDALKAASDGLPAEDPRCAHEGVREAALCLALNLGQDNPAFNLNTFMWACGWKPVGDARKPVWELRE
jgi:hypothetical protein